MHTGGWADKLGNRYEGLWTARQLLLLLNSRLQAVQLESLNEEDEAVDLYVVPLDGTRELHQCKKNSSKNNWTLRGLATRGIFSALYEHLRKDARHRYVFVSNREPVDLKRLIDGARLFDEQFKEFLAHLANNPADGERWEAWCGLLELPSDGRDAFALLRRTEVSVFGDDLRQRHDVEEFARALLDGDPRDVVLRLSDFAVEHMGRPIHVDELHRFIREQTTFLLRDLAFSTSIAPAIEQCQAEYRTTIGPYLIDSQLYSSTPIRSVAAGGHSSRWPSYPLPPWRSRAG